MANEWDAHERDEVYEPIWVGAAHAAQQDGIAVAVEPETATPSASAPASVLEGAAGRVLLNSVAQLASKLLGYACALVTFALSTRLLTATEYGDFTIAVVYLSFFVMLADSGITTAAVREASKFPEALQRLVDTTFSLKLVLGFATYAIAAAIISQLPYSANVKLATYGIAVSFFFLSLAVSWDVVFQSRLQMHIPALADFALKISTAAGIAGVFWYSRQHPLDQQTLFALVVGFTAAGNLAAFAVRWLGARRLLRLRLRFDGATSRYLLRIAVPLAIVSVLGQIHYKADTILLSLLEPPRDVAVYGVAYRVIDLLLVFFAVLVSVIFPVLSRYAHAGGERYTKVVTRVLNVALSLVCPIALGAGMLAPGIVYILGGPGYHDAALPLTILSASLIFSLLNMFYGYLIIAGDRQRSLIWVSIVNIAANLALNFYAIPRFSYIGSAVATDITEGLGFLLALVIANRLHRSLPSLKGAMQVLVACAAMLVVLRAAQALVSFPSIAVSTVALICVGGLVYGVVLLAVGGVDPRVRYEVLRRIPVLKNHVHVPKADY